MDLAEFAQFVGDHKCSRYYNDQIAYNNVSIYGNSQTIVFSNPVTVTRLNGVIHIEMKKMEDGDFQFEVTCEDCFGEKYVESIRCKRAQ